MNNILEYRGYYGIVEFSDADNVFFGKVIGINGLISFEGDSVKSLKEDFMGAIDEYLEMCDEKNIEPQKSYRGVFSVQISPELHKTLDFYSITHGQSMDSTVEEAIKYFVR